MLNIFTEPANLIAEKSQVGLDWGLMAAIIGILVVFCILVLIIFLVKCMSSIAGNLDEADKKKQEMKLAKEAAKKKLKEEATVKSAPPAKPEAAPVSAPAQADDSELVAVITAAVASIMGNEPFVVKSYKKLKRVSSWRSAGRDEELFNKLY